MWRKALTTRKDLTLTILRLSLGVVIFPHGAQKALGLFEGEGFGQTLEGMGSMGVPAFAAVLIILGEFLGSIGLIVGFFSVGTIWWRPTR